MSTADQRALDAWRHEIARGLADRPKHLPPKLFYDQVGSSLFHEITELPEYYPTRTELSILQRHAPEIAAVIGRGAVLCELGTGTHEKVGMLLEVMPDLGAYVPVDISPTALDAQRERVQADFPDLRVAPLLGDWTQPLELPRLGSPLVVFFPGSTVGNFDPPAAGAFLERIARAVGPGGVLVIGVDLVKPREVLEPAYDDAAGVTAAFNKNILTHVNRVAGGDLDPERFEHVAVWNAELSRMEMHLEAREAHVATVGGQVVHFDAGERIHTESSYKYTVEGFGALAGRAGFTLTQAWTDPRQLFSVLALTAR
jgi:L-histidine N-alpha-methyltransferase